MLDPCLSLRTLVQLAPEAEAVLGFVTGIAETKKDGLSLAAKFRDQAAIDKGYLVPQSGRRTVADPGANGRWQIRMRMADGGRPRRNPMAESDVG